ncbi:MAG: hypothetical protein FD187_1120 [bacterium]|nr:MAG: hypothetical protein FD142_2137 [bacterium]KAF0149479.1 MAG: hypothetical protein FD187_1120 [bacterium]KAF0168705.1 MAG: hypothetical protein FD158_1142 [bacterium]TXT23101.1 MAG: hypothetical protein FD132_27 [bacterium]
MRGGRRVFVWALLLSLGVHLLLAGHARMPWHGPAAEIAFPIEALLSPATAATAPPPRALSTPARAPVPVQPDSAPPVNPAAGGPDAAAPVQLSAPEKAVAIAQEAVREGPPAAASETSTPSEPPAREAESTPMRTVRKLPEKLVLRYEVRSGEDGFSLGQATYTWRVTGDRYALDSMAEATGLAALFTQARIVQSSEGRLGPTGLMPERFSMERNRKRHYSARFDWEGRRLLLPKDEVVPLPDHTQDLLSFPFHLAMTIAEEDTAWMQPVTNGRMLKGYRFVQVGRETLEQNGKALQTLHLRGTRASEGSLEVWLAPELHWLPVRIRTEDTKGRVTDLKLTRLEN